MVVVLRRRLLLFSSCCLISIWIRGDCRYPDRCCRQVGRVDLEKGCRCICLDLDLLTGTRLYTPSLVLVMTIEIKTNNKCNHKCLIV